MKNPFKKSKVPNPQVPRSAEDIKKVYFELRARAGEAQYVVAVHTKELQQLNANMESLNREMSARNELDQQAAKAATATKETAAVSRGE
jgi:hypothetical protein